MYNIFFLEIAVAGNMNGVTRCIQVLVNSLSKDPAYNVTWVRFMCRGSHNKTIQKIGSFNIIEIPISQNDAGSLKSSIHKQSIWNNAYEVLEEKINAPGKVILHIHTLNLIDFALYVCQYKKCKIVTHLHCIPWKALLNRNTNLFMELYKKYYIEKDYTSPRSFILSEYEYLCYVKSDRLICVTRCARDFVKRVCPQHTIIKVINNGIEDFINNESDIAKQPNRTTKCLFVGNSHPSKGLEFVLQALDLITYQQDIILYISGAYSFRQKQEIVQTHPLVDIRFTGILPFNELQSYYRSCDIGFIPSLQEQCSYVAIEMMMFGLPVINTDVDGLHELFSEKGCSSPIPIKHIEGKSIQPDVDKIAQSVSLLIDHPDIREKIGYKARRRFKKRYEKEIMLNSIKTLYINL